MVSHLLVLQEHPPPCQGLRQGVSEWPFVSIEGTEHTCLTRTRIYGVIRKGVQMADSQTPVVPHQHVSIDEPEAEVSKSGQLKNERNLYLFT